MPAIHFWEDKVLWDVGYDVQAVECKLLVYQVNEDRSDDVYKLETLDQVVLVGSDKSQVSDY